MLILLLWLAAMLSQPGTTPGDPPSPPDIEADQPANLSAGAKGAPKH